MRLKLACAAEYGVFARCRFQTPFYKKEITGLSLDGHEEDLRDQMVLCTGCFWDREDEMERWLDEIKGRGAAGLLADGSRADGQVKSWERVMEELRNRFYTSGMNDLLEGIYYLGRLPGGSHCRTGYLRQAGCSHAERRDFLSCLLAQRAFKEFPVPCEPLLFLSFRPNAFKDRAVQKRPSFRYTLPYWRKGAV